MRVEDFSSKELQQGYRQEANGAWTCASCGKQFEAGEVFPIEGRFYTAERAVELHVQAEHGDRFSQLLTQECKYLNLTENQQALLALFYEGYSDKEVAAKLNLSPSTVRHQRFMFRERAKAAKLYLGIWGMVEKTKKTALIEVHEGAKMVDERYVITEEEQDKILQNVFYSLEPLRLKVFSSKEKKKIVILRRLAQEFQPGKLYTEKEINEILKAVYSDFATLRRYLIEYGHLSRTDDCKSYWAGAGLKPEAGQNQ